MTGAGGSLEPQGPVAQEIARLWWVLFWLGVLVFVVVMAFFIVGLFRRHHSDTPPDQDSLMPNRWIIIGGILMPSLVIAVVFGFSMASSSHLGDDVPDDAINIEVTGHQWWWEIRYEGQGFATANEFHIPADRPVFLRLTSGDVIHSFWVPELAGKIDALPDYVNGLLIQADEPGVYGGNCAEFCGLQHTNMGIQVTATSEGEFVDWLDLQESEASVPASGDAARGAELFLTSGCGECHTIRGTEADGGVGPDLTHLGSRSHLGATAIPNTSEQLRRWIADPGEMKQGVKMPDVALTEDELDAVVAFLESLR